MSIKTIYTCDTCGKEQTTANQFWKIGMLATNHSEQISDRYIAYVEAKNSLQCCRECLENKFGMLVRKETFDRPGFKEKTIEERLIELCIALRETGEL